MSNNAAPLLVPIAVEALVVNHYEQTGVTFHRWEMEYQNLQQFQSPVPPPFSNLAETPPDPGVHLHWALPRGLTRGTQVQATAAAQVKNGELTAIVIVNGGYGYHDQLPPMVILTGGAGAGALCTAVVKNGVVTGCTISSAGSGYSSVPQVTIAPSPATSFPLIPNRWLIVRYSPAANSGGPRQTVAWVLQSDTINDDADVLQSNSFVNPFPSQLGAIEATRLGTKATVLSSWAGEAGKTQKLFLRALGPSEATFAAYQPGVVNVFSFYDPIYDPNATSADPNYKTDTQPLPENTYLSYLVVGWYSDPKQDPLYGPVTGWDNEGYPVRSPWSGTGNPPPAWESLLSELDWSVEAAEAQTAYPTESLYHGSVYGVTWQTTAPPPDAVQSPANMTVAVGNTSIDALSAIVELYADNQQDGAVEAEMLEAFQYNQLKTLDDADGEAQLELKIREAWFGSAPGGTVWTVVAAQNGQSPTGQLTPGVIPPPPPLTPQQATALALLNRNQRALDQSQQLLYSMQWELYAAWWKQNSLAHMSAALYAQLNQYFHNHMPAIQQLITQNLTPGNSSGLFHQVVQQQGVVAQQAQGLPGPTDAQSILDYARHTLGLDPTVLQLKPSASPRFYYPVDPVVLVAGIETSEKQGTLTGGDSLVCRFITQAVTGVNVEGQSKPVTASTAGLAQYIPTPANSNLPPAVTNGLNALSVETFFVDPTNATTIVNVGLNSTDPTIISDLNKAMLAQTAQVATIKSPLAASFAFSNWTGQPWSPLYMEWDVTFYPTVRSAALHREDNWPFIQTVLDNPPAIGEQPCWSFDGTEFNWYGGLPVSLQGSNFSQDYVGRTFLTPQATYVLISKLKKYLKNNPNTELQAVEALIDKIGDWNILSQRLSGLVDQFIMRDLDQSPPPDASLAAEVGEQFHATPDPSKGNQDTDYGSGTPFFFPVYGGFLKFNRLVVVDSFGQVVDLMQAGGNTGKGAAWQPVRGRGLSPLPTTQLPQPEELVNLSPQLSQSARLNFRFVSATNDQQETGLWPDSNPVCGWVLPNHLDGGLAVYDAAGNALGELLILLSTGGTYQVRWLTAPDSTAAVSDPAKIANAHLSKFVVALVESTEQGKSLRSLLKVIDETLWTVDPLGSRADPNLSVLIGRPLALVRAELQFEVEGAPVYNQSWPDTLQKKAAGVESLKFPVRLGSLQLYDDGLLGYFTGDTYTTFNSVHTPDNFQPGSYLNPVGYQGNYITIAFDYPAYTPQYISMLLDPRGDVHAFTGLFPVKTVSLPAHYFVSALPRLAVTFRTGPAITDAQAIRLPYPTEKNGTWSWIQRTGPADPTNWTDPAGWTVENIVKANEQARLPGSPSRLVEGWLKLTPKDIEN